MHTMLRTFTTAVLLVVLETNSASGYSCYQCASKGLEFQWEMVGMTLPSGIVPATFFIDTCDTAGAGVITTASCADFCFSMLITAVASNGSATNLGQTYFVRGCHADFTANIMQSTGLTDANGRAEYGFVTRYNNQTVSVDTPAGYLWCNIDKGTSDPKTPCNDQKGMSDYKGTNAVNTGGSSNKIPCYDCVEGSTTKPCAGSASMKQGYYCYKSDLWINNQHFITRSTSDINPLFPGATGLWNTATQPQIFQGKCAYIGVNYPVQTRASITFSGYDCFCNFANYCNGASTVVISFVTLSLAVLSLVFMKI